MSRIIKKYGNRKLYDTTESRYLSLSELKMLIRDGETVIITDSKTGEDITQEILTKAIIEQGGKETLSSTALHALIRWGTDAFESGLTLFGKSVHKILPVAKPEAISGLNQKVKELETKVTLLERQLEQHEKKQER